MNKITILIPKIKPPDQPDIVTTQLLNIFSKLRDEIVIELVWIIFQPEPFEEYVFRPYRLGGEPEGASGLGQDSAILPGASWQGLFGAAGRGPRGAVPALRYMLQAALCLSPSGRVHRRQQQLPNPRASADELPNLSGKPDGSG